MSYLYLGTDGANSYDRNLQPRRNEEATLFCKGERYTHKYPVYTL